jgi:glyoxylase-like metal-dependent hydrolase (beta-lactamase superfamily II)
VYAFYDGRVDGYRFDDAPNWVDDGALSLGIASYAIVSGDAALVYDTHVSIEHAQRIRAVLEDDGVSYVTVVLSHWHLDHVAGTEAFDGCEVIACERTAEVLTELRPAIESGSLEGPPAIDPLVLPTTTFRERRTLDIGDLRLELIHTEIHSDDAVVVWWPDEGLLFCGDTLEDTVTYVDEPERLSVHRQNLESLRELGPARILPNHGDPDAIAGGGYSEGLIGATQRYIDLPAGRCAAFAPRRRRRTSERRRALLRALRARAPAQPRARPCAVRPLPYTSPAAEVPFCSPVSASPFGASP